MIKKPYQFGIAVYQLEKLRMLEFYYDFLDKYFRRQDFELWYMDTDSFYMAMRGDSLDEIVRPEIEARGLLQSATLFSMRHSMKINIAAKVFQTSIMI